MGWEVERVHMAKGCYNTGTRINSLCTWITGQEGPIGIGWMSSPTEEERNGWLADPLGFTRGQWRYVVLWPGRSIFIPSGTIHFFFQKRQYQTLALYGYVLQWSGITPWMRVVDALMYNLAAANEGMKPSAELVHTVAKLVRAKLEEEKGLKGGTTATRFFVSIEV